MVRRLQGVGRAHLGRSHDRQGGRGSVRSAEDRRDGGVRRERLAAEEVRRTRPADGPDDGLQGRETSGMRDPGRRSDARHGVPFPAGDAEAAAWRAMKLALSALALAAACGHGDAALRSEQAKARRYRDAYETQAQQVEQLRKRVAELEREGCR